jgi:hypothetical protein
MVMRHTTVSSAAAPERCNDGSADDVQRADGAVQQACTTGIWDRQVVAARDKRERRMAQAG